MDIAIVDDQKEYHNIIKKRLYLIKNVEIVVHAFTSVLEMEKSGRTFNLILLDIDMPDINGIKYSREHLNQNIIFITNHSYFMKKAYGSNVYAFIEKSDSVEYFVEVVKNVIERIISQRNITIKTNNGMRTILEKDIIYAQYIERKTICIKTINGEYIVKGYGLVELTQKLDNRFVFCDRDLIINIDYIIGITNDNKLIVKSIKNKLYVSTRRIAEVKRLYFSKYK